MPGGELVFQEAGAGREIKPTAEMALCMASHDRAGKARCHNQTVLLPSNPDAGP